MSKLIRRVHMYIALFLAPWIMMYAASTFVMNHRARFQSQPPGPPPFEKEREQVFRGQIAPGAPPREIAAAVLKDIGMDGTHNVNASADKQRITILRNEPVAPRRITFSTSDNRIIIEKQVVKMPAFLERMHRRRGYQQPYALEDMWAFSVDLVIAAMVFWALSGLWMWWEMKKTRVLGFAFGVAGCALFALFLFTI
jgi:hypothetical protein